MFNSKNGIIGDTGCPSCISNGRDKTQNHLILFEDGSAFCNRCGYKEGSNTFTKPVRTLKNQKTTEEILEDIKWVKDNSTFKGLPSRGLSLSTLKHYGIRVGLSFEDGHTPVCYYIPRLDSNYKVCGYKVKTFDKKMWIKGSGKSSKFCGSDKVPKKGKRIYITEGEEDMCSLYQALKEFGNPKYSDKIAVVSLCNGAGGADKEMIDNKDLLDRYKEIVLCFDQDEAGREGVDKALSVLPREKVRILNLPAKDANDMVQEGQSKELFFIAAMKWDDLEVPRPEKIVDLGDFDIDDILTPIKPGLTTPFPVLDIMVGGFRYGKDAGELTVCCAGPGVGKTTLVREIAYCFNKHHKIRLGHIFLEEGLKKTRQGYIAMDNNIPLPAFRKDPSLISKKDVQRSIDELCNNGRCFAMDHFGSIASDLLMDHMWYFNKVLGCFFVILDHISLVVSGQEGSSEGERKDIDILMTKLAAFAENSGTSVLSIVHLKRPPKGSFNEGMQISLSHLRGSSAIEGLAHNIIAIEGNQHGPNPDQRTLRVLKCREWGNLGKADTLEYSHETGRLTPLYIDQQDAEVGGLGGN